MVTKRVSFPSDDDTDNWEQRWDNAHSHFVNHRNWNPSDPHSAAGRAVRAFRTLHATGVIPPEICHRLYAMGFQWEDRVLSSSSSSTNVAAIMDASVVHWNTMYHNLMLFQLFNNTGCSIPKGEELQQQQQQHHHESYDSENNTTNHLSGWVADQRRESNWDRLGAGQRKLLLAANIFNRNTGTASSEDERLYAVFVARYGHENGIGRPRGSSSSSSQPSSSSNTNTSIDIASSCDEAEADGYADDDDKDQGTDGKSQESGDPLAADSNGTDDSEEFEDVDDDDSRGVNQPRGSSAASQSLPVVQESLQQTTKSGLSCNNDDDDKKLPAPRERKGPDEEDHQQFASHKRRKLDGADSNGGRVVDGALNTTMDAEAVDKDETMDTTEVATVQDKQTKDTKTPSTDIGAGKKECEGIGAQPPRSIGGVAASVAVVAATASVIFVSTLSAAALIRCQEYAAASAAAAAATAAHSSATMAAVTHIAAAVLKK